MPKNKTGKVSRREVIKLLGKSGADMSKIDDSEIENLRNLGGTIRSIGATQVSNKKDNFCRKRVKLYLAPVISAWCIWGFILFTLSAMEVVFMYSAEEWFIWGILPPVICIFIYAWVKKFILPNRNTRDINQENIKYKDTINNISQKLLFDLCMSGANTLADNHGGFIEPKNGSNDILKMMSKDLNVTILLESIIHSFSLVHYCMLKFSKTYSSSDLSDKFYESTLGYLLQIDSGIYGGDSHDKQTTISRQKKALKHGVEVADHMYRESNVQTFKVLEAASTLYCSKIFKNEVNQIREIINISRALISENDKAIKNHAGG